MELMSVIRRWRYRCPLLDPGDIEAYGAVEKHGHQATCARTASSRVQHSRPPEQARPPHTKLTTSMPGGGKAL